MLLLLDSDTTGTIWPRKPDHMKRSGCRTRYHNRVKQSYKTKAVSIDTDFRWQ